ncbi:membrane protein insertase YidC [Fulvivirga sp. RKSG066]|uniref:membrane protein insertase YidC n=1 Tax=Fulvivirga aurantia TaxID=2529383 RepID=UPI0012BD3B61|nr:membrane protein insertase YidC [Fulvivirga aurantia]MTI21307.1 membrane protein insertase YidC [Fulvivirga aurantia]
MDKNQATGLVLIALLVILYFQFFAPDPVEPENKETTTEATTTPEEDVKQTETTITAVDDSVLNEEIKQKYGIFAAGGQGEESFTTIETDYLKIDFSNKGGVPKNVILTKFKNSSGGPLVLFNDSSNNFHLKATASGRQVDLHELYYTANKSQKGDSILLSYALNLGEGKSIEHIYTIPKTGYQVGYQLNLNGLKNYITKDELIYEWNDRMIAQEKDIEMSRRNSTINFYTTDEDFDNLAEGSNSLEEASVEGVKWVALKQRFFIAAIVADKSFGKGKFSTNINPADTNTVKDAKVRLTIPLEDVTSGTGNYKYFFGPNDYYLLDDVADEFSRNLALGWPPMKWVNKFVIIPLFDFLSSFIGNYGIIIIIMVLIIKLALSPLSYKSYVSMAKMKVLKPELDEIKEKHGEDMSKAQQEQMKLYQKVGVNPVSGCIPMLLQMPILLAMFYFFPQSIELRQEGFLWANDLSTYDSILNLPFTIPFYGDHVSLFVLLMTMSTIMMTYSQQQVSTVQGPMKAFSYMMPLIFMFVLNSYPAALSFYYFVSNIVTFGQQTLIRKFIDEDKIKQILEENKKKNANKKKSKFQQKLEDAMKAQDKKKK